MYSWDLKENYSTSKFGILCTVLIVAAQKKVKELRKIEGGCYDNRLSPTKYSEECAFLLQPHQMHHKSV